LALHPAVFGFRAAGLETADQTGKLVAFLIEHMRGGGRFLNHRGVLLGHLIHLVQRRVDLMKRRRLFLRAPRYSRNDLVDFGHVLDDSGQRLAGRADEIDPLRDLGGRRRNKPLDLLGGLGRALRQRPHLGRDHREAASGIAGTRRLDTRVQREQIGLEGDLVDDADDLADLPGRVSMLPIAPIA
jgi:hypothetical protein